MTVLALQLPIVQGGGLSYAVVSIPDCEWLLWPRFGWTVSTSGQMAVTLDYGQRAFKIAVNLVALAILIWTDRYYRSHAQEERHKE